MFRFVLPVVVLCFASSALAQSAPPASRSGRIEIDGKPYKYLLVADESAQPPAAPATAPAVPSPVILIESKGGAPATVHVHAFAVKLAAGTALTARYEWDFGDPGSRFNALVGWNAAHFYAKAGNYTINLKVTDEAGNVQQFSNPITIRENTRRKVYVHHLDGNNLDDGRDDRHAVQTLERALALVGDDCEVLIGRGGTYELSHQATLPYMNFRIGAWGEGNRPKLRWTGPRNGTYFFSFDPKKSRDLVIEDLSFDTPFSGDTDQANIPGALKPAGTNFTVRNCEFLNIGYAITGMAKPQGGLVQDCSAPLVTGLRAYLVWVESSDFTIIGNSAANSTREHIVRSSSDDAARILIAHNDFTNLDRAPTDKADQSKTTINFRAGAYVYLADNILKDGVVGFGPTLLMKSESTAQWIVVDGNKLRNAQLKISPGTTQVIVRNNFMDIENTEQISIEPTKVSMEGRGISNITIAHNTGTSNAAKGKFLKLYSAAPKGTIKLQNNAFIAPGLKLGSDWACGIAVHTGDLSGFHAIGGNLWPAGNGPVHFLGSSLVTKNYLTAEQWQSQSVVKDDRFSAASLDSRGALSVEQKVAPVIGAVFDAEGKRRTPENCVPGALVP